MLRISTAGMSADILSRHLSADMYVVLGLFPFSSTCAVLHEVQLA